MQSPTNVVGRRVVAFLIDNLISAVIVVIAWFALTSEVPGLTECPDSGGGFTINGHCRGFIEGKSGNQTAWLLISAIAILVIFVIIPGVRGTSPGKAMLGIRLVNAEGNPPGVLRAFLRYILLVVDGFPWIIPYLTGFIVALNSERNQRVGDMAANTFVIDKDTAQVPAAGAQAQFAPTAGWSAPPTGAPVPSAPPQAGQEQKADWYPDPHGQARLRYWDGQRWTEHTSA